MNYDMLDIEPGDIVHEPPREEVNGFARELGALRTRVEFQTAEISYLRKSRDAAMAERDAADKRAEKADQTRLMMEERMRTLERVAHELVGAGQAFDASPFELVEPFLHYWVTIKDLADLTGLTEWNVRAILYRNRIERNLDVSLPPRGVKQKRYRLRH